MHDLFIVVYMNVQCFYDDHVTLKHKAVSGGRQKYLLSSTSTEEVASLTDCIVSSS